MVLDRVPEADPLAFVEGPGKEPLGVHFDMRGATVETAGIPPNASVVVNVLWRPWMKAFADGRPIECRADAWGRVIVPLKGAARVLEVLYRPPWMLSVLAGLALALMLVPMAVIAWTGLSVINAPPCRLCRALSPG